MSQAFLQNTVVGSPCSEDPESLGITGQSYSYSNVVGSWLILKSKFEVKFEF